MEKQRFGGLFDFNVIFLEVLSYISSSMIRWSKQMYKFFISFQNIDIWPSYRPKKTKFYTYAHIWAHVFAMTWPFFVQFWNSKYPWTQETDIYQISKKSFLKSIFYFVFLGQKWAWPPWWRLMVWVLKTESKSFPNRRTFWINHYRKSHVKMLKTDLVYLNLVELILWKIRPETNGKTAMFALYPTPAP